MTCFFFLSHRMGINLTHQEEAALMKRFDHNNDGSISMEEFYNTLKAVA